MKKDQVRLTLFIDPTLPQQFSRAKDIIAVNVNTQFKDGRRYPQKSIARDMDYAPSDLSRKIHARREDNDKRSFDLDDFESYMDKTGDTEALDYLNAKFKYNGGKEAIQRQIENLKAMLGDEA